MNLLQSLLVSMISCAVLQHALISQQPKKVLLQDDSANDPHKIGSVLAEIDGHADLTIASKLIHERKALANALEGAAADLTIFVPTDSAFNHVPHHVPFEEVTELLLYHISQGAKNASDLVSGTLLESALLSDGLRGQSQRIKVTTSNGIIQLNFHTHVVESDIPATNGVIHTVDQLLIPPGNIMRELTKEFRTFGAFNLAIRRTGLVSMIKSLTSATIVAPSNEAFRNLGVEKLAFLFGPLGKAPLTLLVLGSIIPQLLYSSDIKEKGDFTVPTLNGMLDFKFKNGEVTNSNKIKVNDIAIMEHPDLLGSNAVLHGIDTVLEHPFFDFKIAREHSETVDYESDWYNLLFEY